MENFDDLIDSDVKKEKVETKGDAGSKDKEKNVVKKKRVVKF